MAPDLSLPSRVRSRNPRVPSLSDRCRLTMSDRAEQLVDCHHRHRRVLHRRAVVGDHLEPDALPQPRHLAADPAEAHEPQRLALELHALHHLPAAVAHDLVHGGDVAGRGEHEAHGVLGHRRVAIAADVGDLDAHPLRGGEVDEAARARAEEDDVLEPARRTALERGGTEVGCIIDARIVAREHLGYVGLRHRAHVDRDRDVARLVHPLPQPVDVRGRIDE